MESHSVLAVIKFVVIITLQKIFRWEKQSIIPQECRLEMHAQKGEMAMIISRILLSQKCVCIFLQRVGAEVIKAFQNFHECVAFTYATYENCSALHLLYCLNQRTVIDKSKYKTYL